jgi:hypothetical protein
MDKDQPPQNFKCKSCPWNFTYDIKVCEALEHLLDSNLSMLGPLLRRLVSNESHWVSGELVAFKRRYWCKVFHKENLHFGIDFSNGWLWLCGKHMQVLLK